MAKTVKEMIEVMEWFENGGEVECVHKAYDDWERATKPLWNWNDYEYRKKEFQYPIWFKDNITGSNLIVRFDSLTKGEVIVGNKVHKVGGYNENWIAHTDNEHWTQIEEPKEKPKEKVTIERWVIEESNIKFIVETSDIDAWSKPFSSAKKLKLIDSYEVEI